ncbi:hypothetical protein [Rhizobium sp. 11_C7_N12_5]|uniref:hypothetical protein n=1 Tax=Rhizobium sp. 11_C7_N12_5 TaxID=3240770 RepID=UPI003F20D535
MTGAFDQKETVFTQGYILSSPQGILLGHSYRPTEAEAIASTFTNPKFRDQFWQEAQAEGWTIKFVYARIFTPTFFARSVLAAAQERENAGAA